MYVGTYKIGLLMLFLNPGNRYKHRLSLLKGGRVSEQKGLDLDRRVLRLVRAACWAIQVCGLPLVRRYKDHSGTTVSVPMVHIFPNRMVRAYPWETNSKEPPARNQ